MHPVLFEIPGLGWQIYSFGLVVVVAFLVSSLYTRARIAKDLGVDRERAFNLCFALLFVGLAGARLLYVLVHYDRYLKKPLSFLYVWDGGLSFYGGVLAGLLWLAWYVPRHPDLKGFSIIDRFGLGTGLGLFIGLWGSFLSGAGYGEETDVPWAVTFPLEKHTAARVNVPLHPTQVYESLHGLVLFVVLLLYLRRRPHPGRATALFVILYALGRAVLDVWRGDDAERGMVVEGILSVPQLLSVPLLFAGLAIWLIRRPSNAPATA